MAGPKKEMSPGCFVGFMVFFLLISLGLLYWGYNKYQFTAGIISQNVVVTATVVDLNLETRRTGTQRYSSINNVAPVVEFIYQGDTIHYNSEQYSNIVDYGIGDEIKVYVNPVKPNESIINTWSEKWGGASLLFALGGIFFLLSSGSLAGMLFK